MYAFSMNLEAIAEQVRAAAAELTRLDAEKDQIRQKANERIDAIDQKAEPLRAFVEGSRSLLAGVAQDDEFDPWATTSDEDGPRGVDAVLAVMSEQPDKRWTVPELADVILERGWVELKSVDNLPNATRTNLLRAMAKHDAVHRVGHGIYAFGPDPDKPVMFDT